MVNLLKGVRPAAVLMSTALLSTLLAACSQVLDLPSDPVLVVQGPWSCLETPPEFPRVTDAEAEVVVQACDFISNCTTPVTGLNARLCDKRDVGCNNPRATGITDVGGELRFQVATGQTGFDGYLEVTTPLVSCTDTTLFGPAGPDVLCQLAPGCDREAPDELCSVPTFVPMLLFFNPPIMGTSEQPITLQMFPSAALPALIEAAASVQLDPTRGSVFMTTVDCDGNPAPGVTYEIAEYQDQVRPLYLDSGVVSDTVAQTDSSGTGGFILVPPGFVGVTALNSDGDRVGEIGVQTAASFLTLSVLVPSPLP